MIIFSNNSHNFDQIDCAGESIESSIEQRIIEPILMQLKNSTQSKLLLETGLSLCLNYPCCQTTQNMSIFSFTLCGGQILSTMKLDGDVAIRISPTVEDQFLTEN